MVSPTHAIVRPPSPAFALALGQKPEAAPIHVERAVAQHRLYVCALRSAGLTVVELPPEPQLPDSCFVQDTALLLPGLAILGCPAEPSRQGEVEAIRPILATHFRLTAIEPPGTLEWGDVLRLGNVLYVGHSSRTNAQGFEQLRALVAPLGLAVEALPVTHGLHLLSGVTCLGPAPQQPDGPNVLVAWESYADLPALQGMDVIAVPEDEAPAANCLAVHGSAILPSGNPRTAAALWHRGFQVLTVPVGEFAKADGGVTCLSLLGNLPAASEA